MSVSVEYALPPSVSRAAIALDSARRDLQRALSATRKRCAHSRTVETPYVPRVLGHATPPRRMCVRCRIEEEGWGCGYKLLTAEPEAILGREDFFAHRISD